jgi:hypothetical protein
MLFRTEVVACLLGLTIVMPGCGDDNAKVLETPVPKEQLGGIEAKPATPTAPMVKQVTPENYQDYMKATSSSPMQTKGYPGAKKK